MARPTAATRQAQIAAERGNGVRDEHPWDDAIRRVSSTAEHLDPLLTIEQVSAWLCVPKGTLYQWRSRKQGPAGIKVGGGLRYRRSEVDAYLDRHTDSRSA
jgi:excisionase family DNA binding protein